MAGQGDDQGDGTAGAGSGSGSGGPSGTLSPDALRAAFAAEHERRYGYRDEEGEVELVTLRASVWGRAPQLDVAAAPQQRGPTARERVEVEFADGPADAELLR